MILTLGVTKTLNKILKCCHNEMYDIPVKIGAVDMLLSAHRFYIRYLGDHHCALLSATVSYRYESQKSEVFEFSIFYTKDI